MVKKIISLSVITSYLFFIGSNVVLAADGQQTFQDVSLNHENYQAIEQLVDLNAVDSSKANFSPNETIQRKDFIQWSLIAAGYSPSSEEKKAKNRCNDITEENLTPYFNKAIEIRALTVPVKDPKCQPKKSVSKIDALRLTYFMFGIPTPNFSDIEEPFQDVAENAWFRPFILKNLELNILPFEDDKLFYPYKKLTRGQAAETISRAYWFTTDTSLTQPTSQIIEIITDPVAEEVSEIPKIEIFLDIWEKLQSQYYYLSEEEITQNSLIYNAISGMVSTVADRYTEFQQPQGESNLTDTLSGEFEGIGANLLEAGSEIEVVSIIKDSPAEQAGLKAKDQIRKIDGASITGLSLEEVVEKIRGEKGTTVSLTIYRPSENKQMAINIKRDVISITYLTATLNADKIGIFELSLFGESTAKDFKETAAQLEENGMEGIIIDIRNNPGGYLTSAVEILELFIEEGKAVTGLQYPGNKNYTELSTGDGHLSQYPIVILMNEGSASASEILAIALQEYKIATLIGTNSFGKSTVQELNTYDDGSIFKISVAKWLAPSGKSIDENGIVPDIEVNISSEDIAAGKDPQMEKALEEIKKNL